MVKVKNIKEKTRTSKPRDFSVSRRSKSSRPLRRNKPSRYQLKQPYPSEFTIYREEPKKGFFSGRTIEHHAYRITIITIIFAVTAVFSAIIYLLEYPPEHQVKTKIDELASDYYENIFYPNLTDPANSEGTLEKTLSKYVGKGLSRVYLRQFLLLEEIDDKTSDFIKKYCDENSTYVIFYPEPPYQKEDYHTEVTYSCSFE